jgi:purine-binding chemotaxis protein CheW
MEKQLVVFEVSDEHYGVDVFAVDSIIRVQSVTKVPHTPDFVEGVTNLRGTVLPVVDLRRRFGLPVRAPTKDTRIVVAEMGKATVGMVVDAVVEVRKVPEEAIEPPSPLVTTVDSAFITGIAKVDDERLIIVLDIEQVLVPEEKAVLQSFQSIESRERNDLS